MAISRTILITGGRGGIGGAIAQILINDSATRVVTLGRSQPPETSHPRLFHEQGSILETGALAELLQRHQVTHLIHAAGARTRESAENPRLAFEANVLGTDRVFRAARDSPSIQRIIHLSTGAVYGGQTGTLDETTSLKPSSPYAISKAASEIAAFGQGEGAGFSTVILRPAFVIGPDSRSTLADFIHQAADGQAVEQAFPDPFHVHWTPDLALATVRLLGLPLPTQIEIFHPPGQTVSLEHLSSALATLCRERGQEARFKASRLRTIDVPGDLDSGKFQNLCGPFETTTFQTMIRAMIE